jgi:molecular chaperone DnaK
MDYRLVSMMLNAFERQHGYDLSGNETVQQRLKAVAQQIKHELTERESVKAKVTEYVPGTLTELDLEFTLTREAFNRRCADIVDESLETCQEALEVADLSKSSIDHLVMVGGSTRVPLVQRKVRSFFNMDPVLNINPDEVVSIGAAIFGSTIVEDREAPPVGEAADGGSSDPNRGGAGGGDDVIEPDEEVGGEDDFMDDGFGEEDEWLGDEESEQGGDRPLLIDVTPHALGIATVGGVMDIIIERNGSLPLERSRFFSTSQDNQTRVKLPIYAGNSRRIEENRELGILELTNIEPRPREEVDIQVTFSVDTDGMLSVSATDMQTGRNQSCELSILGDSEGEFDEFDDEELLEGE